MKEITRRLYTKPVMLGLAFLMGITLVAALFVTSKSNAAPAAFPVAAGNDEFETAADGQTYHDFAGSPVPAGFFGTGSLAYGGLVALQGVPLSPGSNVDTVIQRHQSVSGPGGSTPITMTGLSLKSTSPITVTYSNNTTETWNVAVGLSIFQASSGTMTINSSTFDSTLKVWPRFTFTRVSDGAIKVWDTGDSGSGLTASSATTRKAAAAEPNATAIATCKAIATDSNSFEARSAASSTFAATTASSCPPVTLSSVNTPWGPCAPNTFCITVPITEDERWARHRPGPKGFIQQQQGVAE